MSSRQHGGAPVRVVVLLGFGILALVGIVALLQYYSESSFTPLEMQCPPVFARSESGDTLYMITGQWPTYRSAGRSRSVVLRARHLVDLWAINAADARPLWRKRLHTARDGGVHDRSLLGVHHDTLWLSFQDELVALSAADGSVKATPEQLEALNPELRGRIPIDPRYFTFDARGLHVTTKDARTWILDPDTLKATADTAKSAAPDGAAAPVAFFFAGTWNYLSRGIDSPGHWVGLLTDEEAITFEKDNGLGGLTSDVRRRLWNARSHPPGDAYGARPDYFDLSPLAGGVEYLDGGLLGEHDVMNPPPAFRLSAPDSVLVLHREHLGESGKLRLARVTTDGGSTVWEAALPLTVVQSVMRSEETVIILGVEHAEHDPAIRGFVRNPPERLVAVNLENGSTHVHSHTVFDAHPVAVILDLGF